MVNQAAVAAFYLLVLAILSNFQLSASSLVCGKVSCLDCLRDFDFSGLLFSLAELLKISASHPNFKLIVICVPLTYIKIVRIRDNSYFLPSFDYLTQMALSIHGAAYQR